MSSSCARTERSFSTESGRRWLAESLFKEYFSLVRQSMNLSKVLS